MAQPRVRPGTTVARGAATTTSQARRAKEVYHEETVEEPLEEQQFAGPVAEVEVGFGTTRKMGDYESLRIDVRVRMPCAPADIEETYKQASEFCAGKLVDEENLWLGEQQ